MKVVDLFCGVGGFSEGFRQAGFEIILGIDIWTDALKSFKYNQKCDVLKADIGSIGKLPNCDVIIGSPPCQNFSRINTKRNPIDGMNGISDFERIVEINKPKYWIWENVEFVKTLYPNAFVLNSFDFGLSQKRKRAFVANFSFFRTKYKKGELTPLYAYDGHLKANVKAGRHNARSGTVRTKRIRDLGTDKLLSIEKVKELMGFPKHYQFCGSITKQ